MYFFVRVVYRGFKAFVCILVYICGLNLTLSFLDQPSITRFAVNIFQGVFLQT